MSSEKEEETLKVDLKLDGETKNYRKGKKKVNFGEFIVQVYQDKGSDRKIDQIIINL